MRARRRLIILGGSILGIAALVVCLTPLLVAGGLRLWAQRAAQRSGLRLDIGAIEAPLLRPVIVHDLRLRSDDGATFLVNCAASRLEVALNLSAIFTRRARPVRTLGVDGLTLDIRQNKAGGSPSRASAWPLVENLLADNFKFSGVQLHIENGATRVDLLDGALSGSELEPGSLTARELIIAAPWFQKTLVQLHGAISWQDNRLSVGAVTVMPGLDFDTITLDLAQIGQSRVGMEMNVDVFGGKVRARISSDDRGGKRIWDVAGNASGVSLARMSDALEWNSRASGSLHASKFTFRGELDDLRNATATLWAEVSGLTWRDRTADTVMIGASLYNRQVQIEQLYLKQRDNQLTLSGELAWPERSTRFVVPAFRGDLSASIRDLGEFARLFGWSPTDFGGIVTANGSVNVRDGVFGGELSVSGNSLVLFKSPVESLDVKLALKESRVEIAQFELHQQNDFFRAEGSLALSADHTYTVAVQSSVAEISNYRGFIPEGILPVALAGSATLEWKGRGANASDSGSVRFRGRGLRDVAGALAPFEAEIEANYSPANIFFRQFHFWNSRADLSAFVTAAQDYFHLQDVRLVLNNRTRLLGSVYLPVSVAKIRGGATWLAALGPDPFFDVDLTVDGLDLAELCAAVKTKPDIAGTAGGRIQLSGTPASLQGEAALRLHDFVLDGTPAFSADVETRLGLGMANINASAVLRSSEPVKIEGALPLQLKKSDSRYAITSDGPLSLTLDFPAIFLANLPRYFFSGVFTRGILSGNLSLSDSPQAPQIAGNFQLVDGKLLRGPAISAAATFKGRNATIDFVRMKEPGADISARGEINFEETGQIDVALFPNMPLEATAPLGNDCVSAVEFAIPSLDAPVRLGIQRIDFQGRPLEPTWTISLTQESSFPAKGLRHIFSLCRDGKTLSLWPAPDRVP